MSHQPHVVAAAPLVLRFGALGDMIMAIPILRAVAQRHGRPCDVIGRGGWLVDLYRHLPFVGKIHTIDSLKLPYLLNPEQRAVVRWLRTQPNTPAYLLQDDPVSLSLIQRGGATIAGWNRAISRDPIEHTVDRHRRLGGFGDDYRRDPELQVSTDELDECRRWLGARNLQRATLVLLQPGNRKTRAWRRSARDHKIWSDANWVQVARTVLDTRPDAHVLFIGSAKEHPLTQRLVGMVADRRAHAVADQLPLRRLFALLHVAHSLISVDTGPAHAAAALGCPAVVLFGATDPRVTGPYPGTAAVVPVVPPGAPTPGQTFPWPSDVCLEAITPTQVTQAWSHLAAGLPAPHPAT